MGDREEIGRRRRPPDDLLWAYRDLLAAAGEGVHGPRQQHLQRLALRRSLARKLTADGVNWVSMEYTRLLPTLDSPSIRFVVNSCPLPFRTRAQQSGQRD